jgi:hypothetical protein
MAATIPLTSLVPVQPVFSDAERLALAGFLAGYRGLTREAYTLDLRQFTGWCRARSVPSFSVEMGGRQLADHRITLADCADHQAIRDCDPRRQASSCQCGLRTSLTVRSQDMLDVCAG